MDTIGEHKSDDDEYSVIAEKEQIGFIDYKDEKSTFCLINRR